MTERPILFSGPLVRAILDGRKTETRRPVTKSTSRMVKATRDGWPGLLWGQAARSGPIHQTRPENSLLVPHRDTMVHGIAPRIRVDHVLWVRETWRVHPGWDETAPGEIAEPTDVHYESDAMTGGVWGKLRPSIHMPRWAARLFLRVTEVRAERVKEIDDAGALREGIEGQVGGEQCPCCEGSGDFEDDPDPGCRNCESTGVVLTPREQFAQLWDSIYSTKRGLSWGENPWVWVIEFEHEVRP